jgi:hypothetical protein
VASVAGLAVSHGIAHPNDAGFAAMAPILAMDLRPQVISAFTPGAVPAGGAAPAPLVDFGARVQLRLADPPEDYVTRPAGSTQTGAIALGALGMGIGVVDVPITGTPDRTTLLARRCGPVSPSVAPPTGCGGALTVPDVLTGTPGMPTGITATATPQGVRVNWTKGSPPETTLRRFLVTATSSISTNSLLGRISSVPQTYSVAPSLRTTLVPLEAGSWTLSIRECTDRGCAAASAPVQVQSQGVVQFDAEDLRRLEIQELVALSPVGIFTTPAGRSARPRGTFPLQISWGVWRQWRELRDLRVRLVGERGELGTIAVQLQSGRATVVGPDSRARRGRLGRKGKLKARRFVLRTKKARIVGSGERGRLVAIELPLALARRARGQRVDVDVAASLRDGTQQDFGPAGSFDVR